MTDRLARRDAAAHPAADLAAFLRTHAHHPWAPPVGGLAAALGHDVVHGLDVTVALGLDRPVPPERLRIVLDAVDPRAFRLFGTDLSGVRLVADDLDWSFGTGAPLHGAAQDLLLLAYGRRLPAGRLEGAEVHRFVTGWAELQPRRAGGGPVSAGSGRREVRDGEAVPGDENGRGRHEGHP